AHRFRPPFPAGIRLENCLQSPHSRRLPGPSEDLAMSKKLLLAAVAIACLFVAQSKARAAFGLIAYGYIDTGYIYTIESVSLGHGGNNATLAGDYAYYALFFANYAYAFDA